jgi:hypothetical protein
MASTSYETDASIYHKERIANKGCQGDVVGMNLPRLLA